MSEKVAFPLGYDMPCRWRPDQGCP